MAVGEFEQKTTPGSLNRLGKLGVLGDPGKMEALLRMPPSSLAVLLSDPVKRATDPGVSARIVDTQFLSPAA